MNTSNFWEQVSTIFKRKYSKDRKIWSRTRIKIQIIKTNSEMKEMVELGKNVKTYILIILDVQKGKEIWA